MDGSSLSSLSEEESSPKENSLPQGPHEQNTSLITGLAEDAEQPERGERLLSGEEQVTLITESMSITSADEEKLLLLNKNTELRRLNKELMKLNEDWDHVYRSTTLGLQQRVESLDQENSTIKQLNNRLLLKVEHEQNKKEYYEHTLMEELKKNQHLQEYLRLLENRLHRTDTLKDWALRAQSTTSVLRLPEIDQTSEPSAEERLSSSLYGTERLLAPATAERRSRAKTRGPSSKGHEEPAHTVKEVQNLKEQLEALRCQTKIYEADYKTEHKDHERMLQENKRLRHREGDMRQQVALLQEQLKVYEDDFHKERSDKQVLQRLLMKKAPVLKDPVLVHRCNNDHERVRGERKKQREEQRGDFAPHPVCPKHCECHGQLAEYP